MARPKKQVTLTPSLPLETVQAAGIPPAAPGSAVVNKDFIIDYGVSDDSIKQLKAQGAALLMEWKPGDDLTEIKKFRGQVRDIRTEIDPYRLKLTAKARQFQDDVNAEGKRIKEALVAIEDPMDDVIKAETKRIEDEKEAKRVAEKNRIDAINKRIDDFYSYCHDSIGQPLPIIQGHIDTLVDLENHDPFNYGEFAPQAIQAKEDAFRKLNVMKAERIRLDQAAELVAKAAEAARLAADAERKRLADEAESARLAKIEEDKKQAAEREKMAADKREFEAEKAKHAAEKKAFDDARLAEREKQESGANIVIVKNLNTPIVTDLNPPEVAQANLTAATSTAPASVLGMPVKVLNAPEMKDKVVLSSAAPFKGMHGNAAVVKTPHRFTGLAELAAHLENILHLLPMENPVTKTDRAYPDYEAGYHDGQRGLIETLLKHMR